MEIKTGDKFEMAWPFYKSGFSITKAINPFEPTQDEGKETVEHECWIGGCFRSDESDCEYLHDYMYTATAEGKVVYEILSIAEMPNRYQDRILFRRTRIDPDGNISKDSDVKMLTIGSFTKSVNSRTPFRCDYEIDPKFKDFERY